MRLFTFMVEVNDKGFQRSDKVFASYDLAEKYMRKAVATCFRYYRHQGMKAEYLRVFTDSILIGFRDEDFDWMRFDFRINELVLFETEEDFSKYPIQF